MTVPAWLLPMATAALSVEPAQLSRFTPPGEGERSSAVLVLFGEGDRGPDILLIQRAANMRTHAGQPAFPGGGLEPGESSIAAALREANEETGLDPAGVDVLAELPALFIPFSGFAVVPVLAWWRESSAVAPGDPAEVAAVVRVPLSEIVDPANRVAVTHPSGWTGPGYEVAAREDAPAMLVWGFTAGLLTRLLELGGLLPQLALAAMPMRPVPGFGVSSP